MLLNLVVKRNPFPTDGWFHRFCSASTPQITDPKPLDFSIKDYLISSFGFTPDKAAKVAKSIAHLKSPHKPDAVRRFLEHNGFTTSDIKALVTLRPCFLCSSVEDTLAPNLRDLSAMGLSTSALTRILRSHPATLSYRTAVPRIQFWKDFFGGDEEALIKLFHMNNCLVSLDIDKNIEPNISLFKAHGLSSQDIRRILLSASRVINANPCVLETALKRTKDLGFQTHSRMFVLSFQAMMSNNDESLKKKMELLKTFGWSEDEFVNALRKHPLFVMLSEQNLQAKMSFLIGEARCDPSYIASHARLLLSSLEKKLRPRNHALLLLEAKGFSFKVRGFCSAIIMTDKQFVDKYILPHKEEIPGLHEAYLTACAFASQK